MHSVRLSKQHPSNEDLRIKRKVTVNYDFKNSMDIIIDMLFTSIKNTQDVSGSPKDWPEYEQNGDERKIVDTTLKSKKCYNVLYNLIRIKYEISIIWFFFQIEKCTVIRMEVSLLWDITSSSSNIAVRSF